MFCFVRYAHFLLAGGVCVFFIFIMLFNMLYNKIDIKHKEKFTMPQHKKLTDESKYKFNQMIEEALIDDRILVKIDDSGKRELYYNLPLMIELKTL